jgi:uncharacterized membrane protein YfcA
MIPSLYLLLTALGLVGGIVSGLVGIGGAILMVPLLLYVPPLFGMEALAMGPVSGITMAQVLASSLAGLGVHRRSGHVHGRLVAVMGTAIVIGAFGGALLSSRIPASAIKGLYTALAVAAALLMALPSPAGDEPAAPPPVPEVPAALAAMAVGVISGIVGAGGAFILLPLLVVWLKVPVRVAVGTSLGIVLLSAISGFAGKALTHQIPWALSGAVVVGSLVGGWAGSRLSRRIPVAHLRRLLAGLIGLVALRMVWDLLP